eukprot:2995024-Amphidinium_carterae.1
MRPPWKAVPVDSNSEQRRFTHTNCGAYATGICRNRLELQDGRLYSDLSDVKSSRNKPSPAWLVDVDKASGDEHKPGTRV